MVDPPLIQYLVNATSGLVMIGSGIFLGSRVDARLRGLAIHFVGFGAYHAFQQGRNVLESLGGPAIDDLSLAIRIPYALWLAACCAVAVLGLLHWLDRFHRMPAALGVAAALAGTAAIVIRGDHATGLIEYVLTSGVWVTAYWIALGASIAAVAELAGRPGPEAPMAALALGLHPSYLASQLLIDAAHRPDGPWVALCFLGFALAVIAAVLVWVPRKAYIGLAPLALVAFAMLLQDSMDQYRYTGLGVARILAVSLLAYAVLRRDELRIDARFQAFMRSLGVTVVFLAAVLLASRAMNDLIGVGDPLFGIIAGALTAAAMMPFIGRFALQAASGEAAATSAYRRLVQQVRVEAGPRMEAALTEEARRLGLDPGLARAIMREERTVRGASENRL